MKVGQPGVGVNLMVAVTPQVQDGILELVLSIMRG